MNNSRYAVRNGKKFEKYTYLLLKVSLTDGYVWGLHGYGWVKVHNEKVDDDGLLWRKINEQLFQVFAIMLFENNDFQRKCKKNKIFCFEKNKNSIL